MAYEVNFTNGTVAKLVEDGITDSTYSVKLVGKNVTAYGETFAENFIRLLENSANTTAPTNPVEGQLWFNTNSVAVSSIAPNSIGVYDGTKWKALGGATVQTTAPTGPAEGDLWYDTTNNQLKVYNGASWDIVGPQYSSVDGKNGPITETVEDTLGNPHVITKIYSATDGAPGSTRVVATVSKDAEYTLAVSDQFTGFTGTIKPGVQLSSTIAGVKFHGEATSLSGYDETDFLSSTANDSTAGTLGILNDGGLTVGASSDLTVEISTDDVVIKNNTSDGDITIGVNDGGTPTTVITIDGATATARVNTDPSSNLGIATKQYVDTAETDAVTTSNNYTDTEITALIDSAGAGYQTLGDIETSVGTVSSASTSGLALKLDKAGGTMTGALTLSGAPTASLHAATKSYVDTVTSAVTPAVGSNGYGTRTVSTSAPSGGSDGDVWYRI
jgi:hypothetical protein